MLGTNAAAVYNFDVDALAPLAERIGPTPRGPRPGRGDPSSPSGPTLKRGRPALAHRHRDPADRALRMTETAVRFDPLAEGYADVALRPVRAAARPRSRPPVRAAPGLGGHPLRRRRPAPARSRRCRATSTTPPRRRSPSMELEQLSRSSPAPRARLVLHGRSGPRAHPRVDVRAVPAPRDREAPRSGHRARVDAAIDQLREQHGRGPVDARPRGASSRTRCPWRSSPRCSGSPRRTARSFRYWTQCVARIGRPDHERRGARRVPPRDSTTMYAYLEEQADRKRAEPADDLMSTLVHAEIDGERLSQEDLVAQLVTLYMAGHEPTASLIAAGTLALLQAPDQLARLRADRVTSAQRRLPSFSASTARTTSCAASRPRPTVHRRRRIARRRCSLRQPRLGKP